MERFFVLPHIHMKAVAAALQSALPAINVHKVLAGQKGGTPGSWTGKEGVGRVLEGHGTCCWDFEWVGRDLKDEWLGWKGVEKS